jgi:hypothetical protein
MRDGRRERARPALSATDLIPAPNTASMIPGKRYGHFGKEAEVPSPRCMD